jgi:hypothetical protein
LPVSYFDDVDEFDPSTSNTDSWPTIELVATAPTAFGAPAPVLVHSCSRLGMQATPRPGFSGWLRRR